MIRSQHPRLCSADSEADNVELVQVEGVGNTENITDELGASLGQVIEIKDQFDAFRLS